MHNFYGIYHSRISSSNFLKLSAVLVLCVTNPVHSSTNDVNQNKDYIKSLGLELAKPTIDLEIRGSKEDTSKHLVVNTNNAFLITPTIETKWGTIGYSLPNTSADKKNLPTSSIQDFYFKFGLESYEGIFHNSRVRGGYFTIRGSAELNPDEFYTDYSVKSDHIKIRYYSDQKYFQKSQFNQQNALDHRARTKPLFHWSCAYSAFLDKRNVSVPERAQSQLQNLNKSILRSNEAISSGALFGVDAQYVRGNWVFQGKFAVGLAYQLSTNYYNDSKRDNKYFSNPFDVELSLTYLMKNAYGFIAFDQYTVTLEDKRQDLDYNSKNSHVRIGYSFYL